MRRLVVASILVVAGAAAAVAADDFPYGSTHSFAVYRNGQQIGTHTLAFQHSGDQRAVATSIDFSVKALGMTVYRYAIAATKCGRAPRSNRSTPRPTTTASSSRCAPGTTATGLTVERKGADTAFGASANDQGLRQNETVRETLPAGVLPSTHWNLNQVKQSVLLNTQYGTPSKVKIVDLGRETIKTSSRSIQATHYRYSGDITLDQWFDDRGRWVKAAFKAFDGSEIEYILQE